jgi:hypothetical protein
MDEGTIFVYCCPSIFFWTSPASQTKRTVYTDSVCLCVGGGEDELCCRPYSEGILHSVSDQIQNLPNCFTTPNKMISEDDIKGLVSLKVHKIEIFFGFDFEICIISLLVS